MRGLAVLASATILLVSALSCCDALAGTPLYVSPSGDDAFDGVSSTSPFMTLSRAIGAASNYTAAVIHVAPGTYSGLKNTELDVNSHSLVCDVAGECTIDAAGSQRAITCANASTLSMLSSPPTISGFAFKAGAGTDGGQGSMVQVGSARVAFVACTFAHATTNAVVVTDDSAAVSFSNCTFSHNGLSLQSNFGSALWIAAGEVAMSAVYFADNVAASVAGVPSKGGAVYASGGSFSCTQCTFTGNSASAGGAMWAGSSASIAVHASLFEGNSATGRDEEGGGGALFIGSTGSVSVNGSRFTSNTASKSDGGSIIAKAGSPVVSWCAFELSSAKRGGAVQVLFGAAAFSDCVFDQCTASGQGGAVHVGPAATIADLPNVRPSFERCSFIASVSAGYGGGAAVNHATPTFASCSFTGGRAAMGRGGGLSATSVGNMAVSSCTFSDNAAEDGGGTYTDAVPGYAPTFEACVWSKNVASKGAGASVNNDAIVIAGTFLQNAAGSNGGALYVTGGKFTMTNSTCTGNTATNGGALLATGGQAIVQGCTFSQNGAFTGGGAVFDQSGTASVYADNVFTANQGSVGGAVFLAPQLGSTTWRRNAMTLNAAQSGGGVFVFGSMHFMEDNTLHYNKAIGGAAVYAQAGGISLTGDDVRFNGAKLGGAFHSVGGNITLNAGVSCIGNQAESGGCAYMDGGWLTLDGGAVLASNGVSGDGGAVMITSGHLVSLAAQFTGNVAGGHGGGAAVSSIATAAISATGFTSNHAAGDGGGLHVAGVLRSLRSSSFTSNTAVYGGGTRVARCPSSAVLDTSFHSNVAVRGGGGIHFAFPDVVCGGALLCAPHHPCDFGDNQALYGPDMSSVPHHVVVSRVPTSVSPADAIAAEVTVMDAFNQTVVALDGVQEAMLVVVEATALDGGSVALEGRTVSAVRFGTVVMPENWLVGTHGTRVAVTISTLPATNSATVVVTLAPCPMGTLLDTGASECVACPELTFSWNPLNATCDLCPVGATCRGGADVVAADGYWHSSPHSAQFHKCLVRESCDYPLRTQTLIGRRSEANVSFTSAGPNAASAGAKNYMASQCADGYSGVLCGHCADNYVKDVSGRCHECSDAAVLIVQSIVVSCLGLLFVGKTIMAFIQYSAGGSLRHHNMSGQMIKIFVSFLQLSGMIRAIDLAWPEWLLQWMGLQHVVLSMLAGADVMHCLAGSGLPSLFPFYVSMAQPVVLCGIAFLWWSVSYMVMTRHKRQQPRKPRASSAPGPEPAVNVALAAALPPPILAHVPVRSRSGVSLHSTRRPNTTTAPTGFHHGGGGSGAPHRVFSASSASDSDSEHDGGSVAVSVASHGGFSRDGDGSGSQAGAPRQGTYSLPTESRHSVSPALQIEQAISGGQAAVTSPPFGRHVGLSPGITSPHDVAEPTLVSAPVPVSAPEPVSAPAPVFAPATMATPGGVAGRVLAGSVLAPEDVATPHAPRSAFNSPKPTPAEDALVSEEDMNASMSTRANAAALPNDTRSYLRYMRMRFVPSTIIIFFFLYPQVFLSAINMLSCVSGDTVSGSEVYHTQAVATKQYLASDTDIVCWEGPHVAAFTVALAVLCVWIAVPTAVCVLLYKNRRDLGSPRMVRTWGYLYACYEDEYRTWEFAVLLRKVVVVSIVVLGRPLGPGIQQQLFFAVVAVSLGTHFWVNPFHHPLCDMVEAGTLIVLGVTLWSGRFFELRAEETMGVSRPGDEWWQYILVVMLTALHILVVVGVLLAVLHHTVSRRLKRHVGATMSTRIAEDQMYAYFKARTNRRVAKVLASMLRWVDQRYFSRERQMNAAHEDLYRSRFASLPEAEATPLGSMLRQRSRLAGQPALWFDPQNLSDARTHRVSGVVTG